MRLIDADAIQIPNTSVDMFENCRNCNLLDEEQVREIINNAPTIEPKRGEWIVDEEQGASTCSNCGIVWQFIDGTDGSNFCPNCGAEMRKESD